MDRKTYLRAVKKAQIILCYVQVAENRRAHMKVSKAKARSLIINIDHSRDVHAEWADEEGGALLIGGY